MARRIKTGNSFDNAGFKELENLLKSLSERSPEVYAEELEKAARNVETDAKSNVNDKTGQIRSSIILKKYAGQKSVSFTVSAGGINAPHAHLVEFGHRIITDGQTINIPGVGFRKLKKGEVLGDVPAHPFLRKAFDENKTSIEKALETALDKLLKEV